MNDFHKDKVIQWLVRWAEKQEAARAMLLNRSRANPNDENWDALFRTIALFRKVSSEVAGQLGFAFSDDLHRRVIEYLKKVQNKELFV